MDTVRAEKIANVFETSNGFQIENDNHGVSIIYLGNRAYFDDESHFWPFVFAVARANHEECEIAEIEAELRA